MHVLVTLLEQIDQAFVACIAYRVLIAAALKALVAAVETLGAAMTMIFTIFPTDFVDSDNLLGFAVSECISMILPLRIIVDKIFIVVAPLRLQKIFQLLFLPCK